MRYSTVHVECSMQGEISGVLETFSALASSLRITPMQRRCCGCLHSSCKMQAKIAKWKQNGVYTNAMNRILREI